MNVLYGAQTQVAPSLLSCQLAQYSLDVLAAAWQARLQVLCVCLCLWEGERHCLESTYATHWVTLHHDRLSQWIKGSTRMEAVVRKHIINATMLWSTLNQTATELPKWEVFWIQQNKMLVFPEQEALNCPKTVLSLSYITNVQYM